MVLSSDPRTRMIKRLKLFCLLICVAATSCSTVKKTEKEINPEINVSNVDSFTKKFIDNAPSELKKISIVKDPSKKELDNYIATDLYMKASIAQMDGDFETSLALFKKAIEIQPENIFMRKRFVVSLIRLGKLKEAKQHLEIIKNSKEKDDRVMLVLGGVYSALGEREKALELYQSILAENPKNEDVCMFYSKDLIESANYNKALKVLKSCSDHNPKKGVFDFTIGKIYIENKDLKKAKFFFQSAYKKQPTLVEAVAAQAMIYEDGGQNLKAASIYREYLDKDGSHPLILSRLVQLYFVMEKYREVIPYAERLSDLETDNLNLKVKLGILYTDAKKYDRALGVFGEILKSVPDSDKVLYYVGAIHQERRDFDQSIGYFQKIGDSSDLFEDSNMQIANMMGALASKSVENENRYLSFVKKSKGKIRVQLHSIAASYLEENARFEDAALLLEKVSDDIRFSSENSYFLASLHEKLKNYDRVEVILKKVIEEEPENSHVLNFLGYTLVERNVRLDEAYSYLSKAIKIAPKDGYIMDSLGWYHFRKGQFSQALSYLNKAVKIVPNDASIRKHLAVIYSSQKKFRLAKKHIVEALKFVNQASERKELEGVLDSLQRKRVPASIN